jgi:hypothetical protein
MTRTALLRRWSAVAVLVASCALLGACGDDAPKDPEVVQPSFDAPCRYTTCSDHGQCVPGDDGSPMCLCNVGYAGDDCTRCEPGFHIDALKRCAPDRACAEQPSDPCGVHGGCNDDDGVIMCDCDTAYEGPRCTLCRPGYGRNADDDCLMLVLGPDGGLIVPPSGSNPDDPTGGPGSPDGSPAPALCTDISCDGHGACDGAAGSIRCDCDDGYEGARCAACAGGHHRDGADACAADQACTATTCNAHGDCAVSNGIAACACAAGYAGAACDSCAPGFHVDGGTTCAADQTCLPTTCAGHGDCTATGGAPTCACAEHHAGTNCEACASGHHHAADGACVVNETCTATSCEPHGSCDASSGLIVCTCDAGYRGSACSDCATGYHADGLLCVEDERCQPGSCSATSVCDESTGEVRCTCAPGYAGDTCTACATGYHRDAQDRCVAFGCKDNPIDEAGTVTFDDVDGIPKLIDNCMSGLDMNTEAVDFLSVGGEGTVWACAASDIYGMPSQHVQLLADSRGSAKLVFAGQIASLSFDYAAATALALDVLADGKKVSTIAAAAQRHASVALTFEPAITELALHATGAGGNRIALDNIAYAPPPCE